MRGAVKNMNILLNILLFFLITLAIQANILLSKRIFSKVVIKKPQPEEEKKENDNFGIVDVSEVDLSSAKEMVGENLKDIKLKATESQN